MNTCALCQEEVTTTMIRQGSALSRGADFYHRDCHRAVRGTSGPRSAEAIAIPAPAIGGDMPLPTSFAEIPEAVEYASFWRRFGAHVIDSFIMNVIVFFASFVIGLGLGVMGTEPTLVSILGGLVGGILPLAYCIWFWTRTGATPGKSALGVRVVSSTHGPLTGGQSFMRFIGYIPSGLFFGIGYLWMLWDDEKRCWHDMIAGTRVIRV